MDESRSDTIRTTLEDLTLVDIQERKEFLYQTAISDKPYSEVLKAARQFMAGHVEWIGSYKIDSFFRGRPWNRDKLPKDVSQLLSPPAEDLSGFGRLNPPHTPRLYTCETVQTVYNELRLRTGDSAVILRLDKDPSNDPLYISQFGGLPKARNYESLSSFDQEIFQRVGGWNNFTKVLKIRAGIRHLMRLEKHKHENSVYRATAALTEPHFQQPEIHGISYPSVGSGGILANVALDPNVVGNQLNPHSAALVEIKWYNNEKHRIFCHHTAEIEESGKLVWNDAQAFTFPQTPEAATRRHQRYDERGSE